ncbi:MAG: glycosyl hydrolase, partial [Acidobacteriota bacterium]
NDLVGASFGRGFYVLDDYTALRHVSEEMMEEEATLLPVRKTPWYIQRRPLGGSGRASQGASYFVAENPPFGAVFTYHLAEGLKSLKDQRRDGEKKLEKDWKDTPYVGFEALEKERRQLKPAILLTVRDANGDVVRALSGSAPAGFHRVAWDLTYPTTSAIQRGQSPGEEEDSEGRDSGFMAPPGSYTVTLSKRVDGQITDLSGPVSFDVVRYFEGVLDGMPPAATAVFMRRVAELQRSVTAANASMGHAFETVDLLERALASSTVDPGTLDTEVESLRQRLFDLDEMLFGNRSRRSIGEPRVPTVAGRLRVAAMTDGQSDYGPTATHQRAFEIARNEYAIIEPQLRQILEVDIPALEAKMEVAGVPWTPGRSLPTVR